MKRQLLLFMEDVMIKENVANIRNALEEAAIKAGRDPSEITLCAATKMNDAQRVQEAIAAGVDCCGENRVQELTEKAARNAYEGAPVHFIGHLQTNKVRQVVGKVDLIQSVDSMRLLETINKEALKQGICQDILLEINVAGEESKTGFTPIELPQILCAVQAMAGVCVKGLMAIPPVSQMPGDNIPWFTKMRQLFDGIPDATVLSMGMSDDFADAIACGSTMIRVGTAIFGRRNYN